MIYGANLRDYVRLKADPKFTAQVLTAPGGYDLFQPNVAYMDDKLLRALNYASTADGWPK